MKDYYKNLTEFDLHEILNLNNLFSSWDTYYNSESKDLYFIGIKKSNFDSNIKNLEKYVNNFVENTSYKIINMINSIKNKKINTLKRFYR